MHAVSLQTSSLSSRNALVTKQLRSSSSYGISKTGGRALSCTAESSTEETSKPPKPLSMKESFQAYKRWQVEDPELPSGEMKFVEGKSSPLRALKMMAQPPWKQIRWGSVLAIEVGGGLSEKPAGRFSKDVTLPQLCSCLKKAAHDPRITGVYLKITPLACGWAKLDELKRHLDYLRQSGKFSIAYTEIATEKEYYLAAGCEEVYCPPSAYIALRGVALSGTFVGGVLRKAGVEPQIQRMGKYKSAGDQIQREDMSDAQREVLESLLDSVYGNLTERVAEDRGMLAEDAQKMLDGAYFDAEKLVEGGWLTALKYEDEMRDMLAQRTNKFGPSKPSVIGYQKYKGISEPAAGVPAGRGGLVAVLRASGGISRGKSSPGPGQGDGIRNEDFVKQVRAVRANPRVKAVVLRVDSPGGDALASDLMWREIQLLKREKPVIASMVDTAASGGYYMSMAASKIVAEKLTLTGSIGVITGKFNLEELFKRVGYTKEVISKGKFAEVQVDNRGFTEEEERYTTESVVHSYQSFRNKAALSRGIEVDEMEKLAQGRVWTGQQALERGLVDQLGGLSTAVAIAKQAAGIPEDQAVTLLEMKGGGGALGFGGAVAQAATNMMEAVAFVTQTARMVSRLQEESTGLSTPSAMMDDIKFESTSGYNKSEFDSIAEAVEAQFRG